MCGDVLFEFFGENFQWDWNSLRDFPVRRGQPSTENTPHWATITGINVPWDNYHQEELSTEKFYVAETLHFGERVFPG